MQYILKSALNEEYGAVRAYKYMPAHTAEQSRAERRLAWGRSVRVHVGQTEDVVNVGREEAVAAMHVLAGVQIFMQTVYYGCHCLKRSLAKVYCDKKDIEEEKVIDFSVLQY